MRHKFAAIKLPQRFLGKGVRFVGWGTGKLVDLHWLTCLCDFGTNNADLYTATAICAFQQLKGALALLVRAGLNVAISTPLCGVVSLVSLVAVCPDVRHSFVALSQVLGYSLGYLKHCAGKNAV